MTHDALGVRITHNPDANEAIVAVQGEIDVANAYHLGDAFEDVSQCSKIVLDITQLRYIDSSGLTVLIAFQKRMIKRGGRLIVAGASAAVGRLLEIAGLTNLFELVPTVDAAT